jgi:hypothetical protein
MGRTDVLSQTDLLLSHEIRVPGTSDSRLRFELNLLNVFNQKTSRHRFNYLNRDRDSSSIDLHSTNLAQGYDYEAMLRATPDGADAFEPRYGMDDLFSDGTSGHFLIKWQF